MESESVANAVSGGSARQSVFRSKANGEHLNECAEDKNLMYFHGTVRVQTWLFARLPVTVAQLTESHLAWLKIKNIEHESLGTWGTEETDELRMKDVQAAGIYCRLSTRKGQYDIVLTAGSPGWCWISEEGCDEPWSASTRTGQSGSKTRWKDAQG